VEKFLIKNWFPVLNKGVKKKSSIEKEEIINLLGNYKMAITPYFFVQMPN